MQIVESKFDKSAITPQQYPLHEFADIAFCGKSNVGKSSLINTLLGRKKLAKTSSTPGKTRLINFFHIKAKLNENDFGFFNIIDLPGYGYAKVSKKERLSWQNMINLYFKKRIQLRGVLVLVDIRHNADPKDKNMIDMLKENNIPFNIVATKSDKIPKSKIPNVLKKLKLGLELDKNQEIFPISSLDKTGFEVILDWIKERIF